MVAFRSGVEKLSSSERNVYIAVNECAEVLFTGKKGGGSSQPVVCTGVRDAGIQPLSPQGLPLTFSVLLHLGGPAFGRREQSQQVHPLLPGHRETGIGAISFIFRSVFSVCVGSLREGVEQAFYCNTN